MLPTISTINKQSKYKCHGYRSWWEIMKSQGRLGLFYFGFWMFGKPIFYSFPHHKDLVFLSSTQMINQNINRLLKRVIVIRCRPERSKGALILLLEFGAEVIDALESDLDFHQVDCPLLRVLGVCRDHCLQLVCEALPIERKGGLRSAGFHALNNYLYFQ